MSEAVRQWERALDEPGSAGPETVRLSRAMVVLIGVLAAMTVVFGEIQLAALPQFTTFHAGFVFLVDAIIAFLLFGQFVYRCIPSYLVLGSAFLFSSLISIPFLLTFPGALLSEGMIFGGTQSSIWVWHFWHILFPAIIGLSLLVHKYSGGRKVPVEKVTARVVAAACLIVLMVAMVTLSVTWLHDRLPVLIDESRHPLTPEFNLVGGLAAAVTTFALALALQQARRGAILHVWLVVLLITFLADIAASLGSHARYTAGWYSGRILSMVAVSILLAVFLNEVNRLYRRLAQAMRELLDINGRLSALVKEKEDLVAELQQREEQIRRMAYHDPVTDLPNRRLLMDELGRALALGSRHHHHIALLFLDLDNFKQVNDTLGHDVGDALLQEVALRLNHCVRVGDIVSRFGGDEFVIVLPEINPPVEKVVLAVATKVLEQINQPMVVMGHPLQISASIGVVMTSGKVVPDELIRRADEAMYKAKKAGRNRYYIKTDH